MSSISDKPLSAKRVAIFMEGRVLSYSPSMLNIIEFLAANFKLDLYSVCPINNIELRYSNRICRKRILDPAPSFSLIVKKIKQIFLKNQPLPGLYQSMSLSFSFRVFMHLLFNPFKRWVNSFGRYAFIIAIEPKGLKWAKLYHPETVPFYYCLELHLPQDNNLPYEMRIDNYREIKGLIIQSDERERLYREGFSLAEEVPAFHIPVCYSGKAIERKGNYLRDKYQLDSFQQIAIYIGSISAENDVISMALQFKELKNWVLILQGYGSSNYQGQLKSRLQEENITNVLLGETFYGKPDEIEKLVASADVGIAWYQPLNLNMTTAGFSSGKIAFYYKCGLPVVTNNYPSFQLAVANVGAGVCLEALSQLNETLGSISDNKDSYEINARKAFTEKYTFSSYEDKLQSFLRINC